MNKEQIDLTKVCGIYHLDSKRLRKRMKSMLKYRSKGESFREMYERKIFMEGAEATIHELRKALYFIHDLRIEDDKKLGPYFSILSGSGILDEIIEKSIDIAVSRCGAVGDDYYRPIFDLIYDRSDGNSMVAVELELKLSHTQTSARHQEALLAVGLAFYTELYAFYVKKLLEEEKKMKCRDIKKYRVRKVKGIRIVSKAQGTAERSIKLKKAVVDLKVRRGCGQDKEQE